MQIDRMLQMVFILLNKRNVTAGELAGRFEVSPRTIYRDIDALCRAGIPIYTSKGKNGGIKQGGVNDDRTKDLPKLRHAHERREPVRDERRRNQK